jgi:hypothetical protein
MVAQLTSVTALAAPMKQSTLDRIAPLLDALRAHPALREARPTVFHLNDRNFLHFHDEPEGIFADVRLSKGFVRMPVSFPAEQSELLERIEQSLISLDLHVRDRQRRTRRQRYRRKNDVNNPARFTSQFRFAYTDSFGHENA